MSPEHKAALKVGRTEGKVVRSYLDALEAHRPRPGRRRTRESMQARLATIEQELVTADPLTRLKLVQERMDLQTSLRAEETKSDLEQLEAEFIRIAKNYSERNGITHAAWREIGVPAGVLTKAGVPRS
jgi:hypothetical protein